MSSKDERKYRNYRGRSTGVGAGRPQSDQQTRESLFVPIDASALGEAPEGGPGTVDEPQGRHAVAAAEGAALGESAASAGEAEASGAAAAAPAPAPAPAPASASAPAPVHARDIATMSGEQAAELAQAREARPQTHAYSRDAATYAARKKTRFSSRQRIALVVVFIIAAIVCAAAGAGFAYYQNQQSKIDIGEEVDESLTAPVNNEPYYVLVLGSDKRPSEGSSDSRSDVMMLVRVDEPNKQITLVSFPRDTMVELGNYGRQKINAAFQLGGASLAISTVEDYANVKISHYVEVYFDGFADLVDDLGGVDVDVPEYVSYGGVELQPGEQHLNGKQALVFARNRKTYATGDFRRTECQRILVQALAEKLLSKNVTELPSVIDSLTDCFSTDMSLDSIVALAINLQGMTKSSMYSCMVPSTAGYLGDVSYTFTYINRWKLMMERVQAGEDPTLDKKELSICGYTTTRDAELDMTEDIPSDIRAELDAYAQKKAKKAAKKQAESGESGDTSSDASSGDTEDAGYVAKDGEIVQE